MKLFFSQSSSFFFGSDWRILPFLLEKFYPIVANGGFSVINRCSVWAWPHSCRSKSWLCGLSQYLCMVAFLWLNQTSVTSYLSLLCFIHFLVSAGYSWFFFNHFYWHWNDLILLHCSVTILLLLKHLNCFLPFFSGNSFVPMVLSLCYVTVLGTEPRLTPAIRQSPTNCTPTLHSSLSKSEVVRNIIV